MERFKPWSPKLEQLYLIYQIVILNKRHNFEFGSGWSTLIFIKALNELKIKYLNNVKFLRKNNPFSLFVVDNEKNIYQFQKKEQIHFKKNKIRSKVHFLYSDAVIKNIKTI